MTPQSLMRSEGCYGIDILLKMPQCHSSLEDEIGATDGQKGRDHSSHAPAEILSRGQGHKIYLGFSLDGEQTNDIPLSTLLRRMERYVRRGRCSSLEDGIFSWYGRVL